MSNNEKNNNKNSFWMREEMAIIKHPWFIIILTLAITAVLFVFMTRATTDNDLTRFLPDDNKERIRFQKFEYLFGSGSGIAIAIKDKENENIYNVKMVKLIHKITKRINRVNNVILKDLLKKSTSLKGKELEIFFNFLLTEMGREKFSLKGLKKDLTNKTSLATKLGVNLQTQPENRGTDPDDVDADDVDTEDSGMQNSPKGKTNVDADDADKDDTDEKMYRKPANNKAPADPDDEEQEQIATTAENVVKIVKHFKTHPNEIEKIYASFSMAVDKWKRYKSIWVDDVMSITDTDYAQGEFADKSKYYKAFEGAQKEQIDLLLTYLIEKNLRTEKEMKNTLLSKEKLTKTVGLSKVNADVVYNKSKKMDMKNFAKEFRKAQKSFNYQTRSADLIKIKPGQKITKTDVELLKHRVRSWKFYSGAIVSYDEKNALILVKTVPNILSKEISRLYGYIKTILNEETAKVKDIKVHIAGEPTAIVLMGKGMADDLQTLFPFVVILVIIFLYLSFRHIRGVILPLVTVILSVIWTIGFMALTGIPLSVMATTIPTLLVAVGSAYGIHLINDYYMAVDRGVDKEFAIKNTLKKVGLAVILAGLTTIIGFTSNVFNEIVPIREFGVFAGLGVFFALIISMTFIPALLRVGKIPKKFIEKKQGSNSTVDGDAHKILEALGRSTYNKRWIYIAVLFIVIVFSIIGSFKIVADMDNIKFFKKHTSLRKSDIFLNKNFGGTNTVLLIYKVRQKYFENLKNEYMELQKKYQDLKFGSSGNSSGDENYENAKPKNQGEGNADPDDEAEESVLKDSDSEGKNGNLAAIKKKLDNLRNQYLAYSKGLLRPEFLNKIESIQSFLAKGTDEKGKELYPGGKKIGKIISANDMLKKFNQTMSYGDEKEYVLPSTVSQAVQYITTFHSDNIKDYITKDYRTGRMVIQMKDSSSVVAENIMKQVKTQIQKQFPMGKFKQGNYITKNGDYEFIFSGLGMVKQEVNNIIVDGQRRSIIFSLLAVFVIILIAYRTLAGGLISMIPLGVTIMVNFGVMGFFGIDLNASTALVASIAIGIGVDYTIHYINTFRAEAKNTQDIEEVIEHTTSHSGRAILINAISVTAGFLVLIFSNFNNIVHMGVLVAITMGVSSIASITIIPALLSVTKPKSLLKSKNNKITREVKNES